MTQISPAGDSSARLLTPTRSHASRSSEVFTPKRSKNKKHDFVVPIISVTTPASDDGHGATYGSDHDDDVPLSQRRGSSGRTSQDGVHRSNSLKKAQSQISKAQTILGDNISSLEYDRNRSESLGEGTVSFRHISGSRRKNMMLIGIISTFGVIVIIVVIIIGIMAAVNKGSPF